MEKFADFIVNYIEKTEIHGRKGWIEQLSNYQWKTQDGIEFYHDGLKTSVKFQIQTHQILQTPDNFDKWCSHCKSITSWGRMKEVSLYDAERYLNSVKFLLQTDPPIKNEDIDFPICGKRIATASKIYYFSDPLRWTIYDSRVAYAIHQLIFEYAKKLDISPLSVFHDIPLCLPQSRTKRRKSIYKISQCDSSKPKSKISFIWTSYLHRFIANKLNETPIPKPTYCISPVPRWELSHVEMVLFMIGDRNWVVV
jgi:hypothetical protein